MGAGKEFPDGLFEAQNGDKIIPQVAPGYCIDNTGVHEAFVKFYQEAAKVAVQMMTFLWLRICEVAAYCSMGKTSMDTGRSILLLPLHTGAFSSSD